MGFLVDGKLPFILGGNVTGTIRTNGEAVGSLKEGDSIFGLADFFGPTPDQMGLQEYAILNADAVAKLPQGFSHEQVATLPINLVTSWIALFGTSGLGFPAPFSSEAASFEYGSQNLVVMAAGASVGRFAVQLAAIAGIGKIIAVAGPGSKGELLDMGATHFVDRHLEPQELVKQIHAITGAEGVTHLYHCHGRDWTVDTALLARNKPSFLRSVHRFSDEQGEQIKVERPLSNAGFVQCSIHGMAPYAREFWAHVPKWLVEGKLRPGSFRVIEGLEKVDEINEALGDYAGGSAVQVVVHP